MDLIVAGKKDGALGGIAEGSVGSNIKTVSNIRGEAYNNLKPIGNQKEPEVLSAWLMV